MSHPTLSGRRVGTPAPTSKTYTCQRCGIIRHRNSGRSGTGLCRDCIDVTKSHTTQGDPA